MLNNIHSSPPCIFQPYLTIFHLPPDDLLHRSPTIPHVLTSDSSNPTCASNRQSACDGSAWCALYFFSLLIPLTSPTLFLWSIGGGVNAVGLSIYLGPVNSPNDRPSLPPSSPSTFCAGYWKEVGAVGLSIYLGPANLPKIDRQRCRGGSVGLRISSYLSPSTPGSRHLLQLIPRHE